MIKRIVGIIAVLVIFTSAVVFGQTSHSVNLSWTASTTVGVQYNVYRGTVTGGPYAKIIGPINGTIFNDTTGAAGTHYFYVVTAVCGTTATCPVGISGESAFSNETSATFLGNPAAPSGLTSTSN
jgi:fibronectin type 3 domain-containing protein